MRNLAFSTVLLAGLAAAFLISVPTAFADPNLISWWKFDEGTGSTAYDSAGGNNGTLVNGPTRTTGRIGGALSFDGSNDYVALSSFTVSTNNGTIALWFKTSANFSANYGGVGYLISRDNQYNDYLAVTGNGTAPYGIYGETNSNNDYFVGVGDVAPVNVWNHIAVSFYNKTARTYLNGVLIQTSPVTNSSLTLDRIGGRTTEFFNGKIDDVRFYDTAFSAEEIWQLYQEEVDPKASNPTPADRAEDVAQNTILYWLPGKNAASHDVYLGSDYNDVNNADTSSPEYKGSFDVNHFDPCKLDFFKTYYWRIDEVNGPDLWKGNVWRFQTGGPEIRLSVTQFLFAVPTGGANSNVQTLGISNSGQDSLDWQITEDCSWLSVEPNSGSSTGEVDDVNLSVDISGLAVGKYTCSLTVSDTNASNNPQTVGLTLYVKDPNDISYVPSEYPTIQAAIDASVNGNTIVVAPGTYTPSNRNEIDFLGKAITVRSADPNDPNTVAATIVDCRYVSWGGCDGFYFHNGEDASSALAGFTIINGNTGIGIVAGRSSPTITNCVISNGFFGISCYDSNAAIAGCTISKGMSGINCRKGNPVITNCTISGNYDRGISCDGSNPVIIDCTITGNSANQGGGIYCRDSNATITGCIITGNSIQDNGGGIYCEDSNVAITGCTITGNLADDKGGGIYCRDGNVIITGCDITDNLSYGEGCGIYCYLDNSVITNCTISGNSTYSYGGAIHCSESNSVITNCIINDNIGGGGISCEKGKPEITNCTITGNEGTDSGGISCRDSSAIITGCTITGNLADGAGGIYCDSSSPIITGCTISGNSAGYYGYSGAGGGIYGCVGQITNCNITANSASYGGGLAFCEGTITNCTITGNSASDYGGGIYDCDGSITNCTITGNSAYYAGGGLSDCDGPITNCVISGNSGGEGGGLAYGSSHVTNCTITGNSAYYGGGLCGSEYISNCTIANNLAYEDGGGVGLTWGPIVNCTITNNSAGGDGGGICADELVNCTVIGNSAGGNGGGLCSTSYGGSITNCIFWDNKATDGSQIYTDYVNDYGDFLIAFTNIQGGWHGVGIGPDSSPVVWGPGNIDTDPCFVDTDANDYLLKSEGWRWDNSRQRWDWDDVTSRCIDAGNPGSPLGDELLSVPEDPNNIWGHNLRIDMGALGGTAKASIPPYDWALLSDTTNDGISDFSDIDILSSLWLNSGQQLYADFNRDGIIDLFDFALLAQDWLKQTTWR